MCDYSPLAHVRYSQQLRVMFSISDFERERNPFIRMLADSVAPHVEVREFSWTGALLGSYDVLHIHWPEHLIRGRASLFRPVKILLFWAVLLVAAARRIPVVWTVHNLAPHQSLSRVQRVSYRFFLRRVELAIFMQEPSPAELVRCGFKGARAVIPHISYRQWADGIAPDGLTSRPAQCDFLFFGAVKRYKNPESLVEAFASVQGGRSLYICGPCDDRELEQSLIDLCVGAMNVTLNLAPVPDAELISSILRSRLIVLPYGDMYNSGSVLLAISLGVPVLVPDTPTNRGLRAEFGDFWVRLFADRLTADDLLRALPDSLESHPLPEMADRSPARIGSLYCAAYNSVRRG